MFQDKYSKNLNFPTLFFGLRIHEYILQQFRYQQVALEWELEHGSTKFESHATHHFFKEVKFLVKKVSRTSCISISIGKLKGKKLLAKDVKKKKLEKFLKYSIGYRSLKEIRT